MDAEIESSEVLAETWDEEAAEAVKDEYNEDTNWNNIPDFIDNVITYWKLLFLISMMI